MFKTTSFSISVFFLFSFLLVSCGSDATEGSSAERSTPSQEHAEKAENGAGDEPQQLTEETAERFLQKYAAKNPADEALVKTPYGDIRIRLYENTPLHRANFVYLARQDYFDETWFYRVSKGHVIQAGNTDAQRTVKKRRAIGDFKVPGETGLNYHKRGAVAAARSYFQNPDKDSDPYEFYIVLGRDYTRRQLERLAEKHDVNFREDQLDFYSKNPGAPHLDGQHTVFGEVIEGMDVVEKINEVKVDEGEWPLKNIPIDVEVVEE